MTLIVWELYCEDHGFVYEQCMRTEWEHVAQSVVTQSQELLFVHRQRRCIRFWVRAERDVYIVKLPPSRSYICGDIEAFSTRWYANLEGISCQVHLHPLSNALGDPDIVRIVWSHGQSPQTQYSLASRHKRHQENEEKKQDWPAWVHAAREGVPPRFRKLRSITPTPLPTSSSSLQLKRGKIRVLKIYSRFVAPQPHLKQWPYVKGYTRLSVCKDALYQDLSPMKLGPVLDHDSKHMYALNLEDAWQCSKVWLSQMESAISKNKRGITVEYDESRWLRNWLEWSYRGRFSGLAKKYRHPNTKTKNQEELPLFFYYLGRKLDVVAARKQLYIPWYYELAIQTTAYQDLKARHLYGEDLLLLEQEGLDRDSLHQNRDLDRDMICQLVEDEHAPFGHGLILAAMLLDSIVL